LGLVELEITGFKSFAKKTKITFSKGINAIVGPNGCGKSNIVDAFLWTLGAQSARSLRAGKMHDVIFAGTQSRKPLHFAEVSITFDNHNSFLPIAYQEVVVTRRILRDNSSEYYLNKKPVRLKDVLELFAHTGLGHDTFAVIGQGRVEKIISQSPQERRSMFEEVAGISHFLVKRKESMLKLEHTQTNVLRAQDIVKEIVGQKETLEKQAKDAKKYQQDKKKLHALERAVCQIHLKDREGHYSEIVGKIQELEKKKKEFEQVESDSKKILNEKKEQVKLERLDLASLSDTLHAMQTSQSLASKEISFALEQHQSFEQKILLAQKEIEVLKKALEKVVEEKKSIENDCHTEQHQHDTIKGQFEESDKEWQKVDKGLTDMRIAIKAAMQEQHNAQIKLQSLDDERKRAYLAKEVALEKRSDRVKQIEKLEFSIQELEKGIEHQKSEKLQAVERVDAKKESLATLFAKKQALGKEQNEKQKAIDEAKKALLQNEAHKEMLLASLADLEGLSKGAKFLMQEAKNRQSPLFNKILGLVDLFDPQKTKDAVSCILSSVYASCVVVKTENDLEIVQKLLKEKKFDASLICLEYIALADVSVEGFSEKETEALTGYFDKAIVLCDADLAKNNMQSQYLVTKSLDAFVDSLGVVFFGKKQQDSLLEKKRKLQKISQVIDEQTATLFEMQKSFDELVSKKESLEKACKTLDEEMRTCDFEVVSTNFRLQELEKKKTELIKECTLKHNEIKSLKELVDGVSAQDEQVDESRALCEKRLMSAKNELQEKEAIQEAQSHQHKKAFEARKEAEIRYTSCRELLQKKEHALSLCSVREAETKKQYDFFINECNVLSTSQKELVEREKKATETLKTSQGKTEELKSALCKKSQDADSLEKEIVQLEDGFMANQKQKEALSNKLAALEVERNHLSTEKNRYSDMLQELEVSDFEIDSKLTLAQMEAECKRLRSFLDKNQNVNLMAIEELETVSERHDFFQKQLEDLRDAKEELEKIIEALENESKTAFIDTFEKVRSSFQHHFQTLFNGGEADLVLTDDADYLQAGVEILAKPPGKALRSMQLMSGGEKSLTALALLFACFEVRPSPFCILDEVDAALDEANVERFGTLLKSFADDLQFLVITHNKRTMASSDTLIGVSMQEKGVSQIIALDFKKSEKPEAAIAS